MECKPAPKCAAGQTVDPVTGSCVVVSNNQIIPVTGSESRVLLLLSALLMLMGLPLIVAGRGRPATR